MINKILNNSLLQNTGVYTVTSLINAALPFLLLPILTRYLTPESYGIVSMFTLLSTIVTPIVGFVVNGAISRMYYDNDLTDLREYVFNCILLVTINTCLVIFIVLINLNPLSTLTKFPKEYLWSVVIYSLSQVIVSIILALWQVNKKAFLYGVFSILQTITNFILSIILVVSFGMGWKGRVLGQLISSIIFAVISLVVLQKNRWIKISVNKKYLIHIVMFGLPLIPHALSGTIISMTDRLFITNMEGLAATGVYTVGYQVGSMINLLAVSFNNAYVPWLYERLKINSNGTKMKIVKFTYLYFIAILLIALVLGLGAPVFLTMFLGKSFNNSGVYVLWIAIGYAFNGMYLMVVNYIFYAQKNGSLAFVTFLTAIINIILNYIFIKKFGAIGAAQATTIVFVIKFVMVWILSSRVYEMPWSLKKNN